MQHNLAIRVIIYLLLYFGLRNLGGEIGTKILYPINLLVTFLHEFGHAIGAIVTGGEVLGIQVNDDGSGFTKTIGGNKAIILMGGYIGSAFMGNLIFLMASRFKSFVKPMSYLLIFSMIYTAVIWYNSAFTSSLLLLFALIIFAITWQTDFIDEVLMFIGLSSILYIIQDFNVGPSSDLNKYAEEMVVLPVTVWKYAWLIIVVMLTYCNIKIIFNTNISETFN